MQDPVAKRGVIRASTVRQASHPVLVECRETTGSGTGRGRASSVIPMMDGNVVAGIEVRCACGETIVIECVYPDTGATPESSVAEPD